MLSGWIAHKAAAQAIKVGVADRTAASEMWVVAANGRF